MTPHEQASKQTPPNAIFNVSMSIFSVARHYGGCKALGQEYVYLPNEDALILKKHVKAYKAAIKKGGSLGEFLQQVIINKPSY
jgi:hypothetical protein